MRNGLLAGGLIAKNAVRVREQRSGCLITLGAILWFLAGCSSDRPIELSITPEVTVLEAGGSVTFDVVALNTKITWPESVPGSFTVSGTQVSYTPPHAEGRHEFTVAASADQSITVTAAIDVFVPPVPEITSFNIEGLGEGILDDGRSTIAFYSLEWIDNLDSLAAEFSTNGLVTVGDVPQVSGETLNNYYRAVSYTVSTGEYAHRTYTVRVDSPQTTGLPIIRIDTQGQEEILSKEDYLQANIEVIDPRLPEFGFVNAGYRDQIRGRGNSTWTYPKKPFRIRFDSKTSMFGLVAARNWVLLANWQDPTLMMNTVAFELGQRFALPYSHSYNHVEVFLNGVHQGSYLMTEHNQVGEGRVDIDEDTGFFVELDAYFDEDPKFTTDHYALPVMIKSPQDLDDLSGYDFVRNAINGLEAAMASPLFPDSGYRDLIDMRSFVDFLLINEIVANVELGWPKSVYMYKDTNGKIGLGPLWDFDWGFSYGGGHQYFLGSSGWVSKHGFFARFFEDPQFVDEYKARWTSMRSQIAGMTGFIDQLANQLLRSQEWNFLKWPQGRNNGYQREISDMKTWWRERMEFLDSGIDAM